MIKIVDTESIISATMLFLTVVAAQFINNLGFLRSSWPFYVPFLRPISSRKDLEINSFSDLSFEVKQRTDKRTINCLSTYS